MSYYIKIHRWAGQNPEIATARFAKVFYFSSAQAAGIMLGIQKGQAWQFDRTISPSQSEKARVYLQSLGYEVELLPVVIPHEPTRKAASETLAAPMEALPRKSSLDFLKKIRLGDFFLADRKSQSSRQSNVENATSPKKPLWDFLKKAKTAPAPKIPVGDLSNAPDVQIEPLPKKSFLDFLKKKKTDSAPEIKKTEPQAYRRKSNLVPVAFIFILIAAVSLLPYYFGMRAEAILGELMPRMFQKGVVFKFTNYDRGWLKSKAEYLVNAPGVVVRGTSEIEHGPFSLEELLAGNINYFQARVESKIPVIAAKAPDGSQVPDPLENLVMKGYFVKKGKIYKMDLLVLDEGLNVNGKLIPSTQK